MTIAEKIAHFCVTTPYEDLTDGVREIVKLVLADAVGVCVLGAEGPASQITADYVRDIQGTPQGVVVRKGFRAPLALAALVNAQQAHIDDFDDNGVPGHVSSVLCGAALALAEYCHASGPDVLRAYTLAMEVEYRVADVLMEPLLKQGFCCSPVFGCIGAAVLASVMLGLNEAQICNAIAIVCSNTGGVTVNFGSSCKPYQIGLAAQSGVEAALLAQWGFDGKADCIEGKGGYAQVYCGRELAADDIDFDRKDWMIEARGVILKQFPSCLGSHGAVLGMLRFLEDEPYTADDIAHVNAGVCWLANRALAYPDPKTITESRFSMNFAVANVLAYRYFGLHSFEPGVLDDPAIQENMKKVSREHPEEMKDIYADETMPTILTITLKDGTVLRRDSRIPRVGAGEAPADLVRRIRGKFEDCTAAVFSAQEAGAAFERILALEREQDLNWLLSALIR